MTRTDAEGIWVDKEFAEANGYAVGDQLTVRYTTYKIDVKIAGLVETPDHAYSIKDATQIFPDHNTYGYVYLSYRAIPDEVLKDAAKSKLDGGLFRRMPSKTPWSIRCWTPQTCTSRSHFRMS